MGENPIRPPENASEPPIDDNDDTPSKEVVSKVSSIGEDMLNRRSAERERQQTDDLAGIKDVLGGGALFWQKKMRTETAVFFKEMHAERFAEHFAKLQRSLGTIAARSEEDLEKFFQKYFDQVDDFPALEKTFTEEMGFEFDFVDETTDKVDVIARRKLITDDVAATMAFRYAFSGGEDNPYPPSFIMPMMEYRMQAIERLREQAEKDFLLWRSEFSELAAERIGKGSLPIDPAVLKERLDAVRFDLVDGLVAKLDEKWGDFIDNTHTVRISSDVPEDRRKKVMFHEFFHAISGQSEITTSYVDAEFDGAFDIQVSEQTRVGTHFSRLIQDNSGPQLKWLNEAMTERLTMELLGAQNGSYKEERALLAMLIASGLSEDKVRRAYFENYILTEPGTHRTPKLKDLFNEANEKFGRGFLVDLDHFIRSEKKEAVTAKKAVALWKLLGEDFPEFLREQRKRGGSLSEEP